MIIAGIPNLLSLTISTVAAANDEQLCPDGKLKPDGGFIAGIISGFCTNGRGLSTMFLSPISPTTNPTATAHNNITPVALVLRKHIIIIDEIIHIPPASPK